MKIIKKLDKKAEEFLQMITESSLYPYIEISYNQLQRFGDTLNSIRTKSVESIVDLYFVGIKGLHKHDYQRIDDGITSGINWQRHQCTGCKKVVGLDDWQILELPYSMKYEKIPQCEPAKSTL